jgi:hypothetical protein
VKEELQLNKLAETPTVGEKGKRQKTEKLKTRKGEGKKRWIAMGENSRDAKPISTKDSEPHKVRESSLGYLGIVTPVNT